MTRYDELDNRLDALEDWLKDKVVQERVYEEEFEEMHDHFKNLDENEKAGKKLDSPIYNNFKNLYFAFMWKRIEKLWGRYMSGFQSHFNVNNYRYEELFKLMKDSYGDSVSLRVMGLIKSLDQRIRDDKLPHELRDRLIADKRRLMDFMYEGFNRVQKSEAADAVRATVDEHKVKAVAQDVGLPEANIKAVEKDLNSVPTKEKSQSIAKESLSKVSDEVERGVAELMKKYQKPSQSPSDLSKKFDMTKKSSYENDKNFNRSAFFGKKIQSLISSLMDKAL
jgi:hypothetical protein